MEIRLVLIEAWKPNESKLFSSSAIMLNDKYILTTGNIVLPHLDDSELKNIYSSPPRQLHSFNKENFNVVWRKSNNIHYHVKSAKLSSYFISQNIKDSDKFLFKEWAIDALPNNFNLNTMLSVFFIFTLTPGDKCTESEFNSIINLWWTNVKDIDVNKGDEIFSTTASFGNRNFMDSYSKGIVSNMFGNQSCFLLSDCSVTPGSEGSPVYKVSDKSKLPFGIILASMSWWKGEWIGLTLIADIRIILLEFLPTEILVENFPVKENLHFKLLANVDYSLVQVYCGPNWGTAIVMDVDKGILLTNAHVIDNFDDIKLYWKGKQMNSEIIYKSNENDIYDLAILQVTNITLLKQYNLKSIKTSSNLNSKIGDTVYSGGFSLFSKDCNLTPNISRGVISDINYHAIKTTCCIHPGNSGGGIFDSDGNLIGIVVCNVMIDETGQTYPRVNMAIPFAAIKNIIETFIQYGDPKCLRKLTTDNLNARSTWCFMQAKL